MTPPEKKFDPEYVYLALERILSPDPDAIIVLKKKRGWVHKIIVDSELLLAILDYDRKSEMWTVWHYGKKETVKDPVSLLYRYPCFFIAHHDAFVKTLKDAGIKWNRK